MRDLQTIIEENTPDHVRKPQTVIVSNPIERERWEARKKNAESRQRLREQSVARQRGIR